MAHSRSRPRLGPDAALQIKLNATAHRLIYAEKLPRERVIEELRTLSSGRADMLALAAADHLGGWLAEPAVHWDGLACASALIAAGADVNLVVNHVDTVRANASAPRHCATREGDSSR